MKIAIIGGGYTGLSTSYHLSKKDCEVVLFEKEGFFGGLASGFKKREWKWSLDKYYHHIFTTDQSIIALAKEVGCNLLFIKPKTSIYYAGRIFSFDSAIDLLMFSYIPFVERVRTGITILFLKVFNNWKSLESISASKFIRKTSGDNSWKIIWQPLFRAKFDTASKKIPASWFWSRIKKRGRSFGYPEKGFDALTEAIVRKTKKRKVKFLLNTEVISIKATKDSYLIKTSEGNFPGFDKVICTLPAKSFLKMAPNLPIKYRRNLKSLESRGTINLILSLKKKYLTDGTYWLNVNDKKFPFVGVVEQTNFIPKNKYNNNNIIHIVNYLPSNHPFFKTDKESLIKKFSPYLKKMNPKYSENWINESWVFKSEFAQPVVSLNYSKKVPAVETPIKNIYLANMQQIYPWDRQTNYAVELGKKLSEIIFKAS